MKEVAKVRIEFDIILSDYSCPKDRVIDLIKAMMLGQADFPEKDIKIEANIIKY